MAEDSNLTDAITDCCRQLFQKYSQMGAWGLSVLQTLANIDLKGLPPEEVEALRLVPAMVFYGVHTIHGVLMRTLSVPRSVAAAMGERFKADDTGEGATRV